MLNTAVLKRFTANEPFGRDEEKVEVTRPVAPMFPVVVITTDDDGPCKRPFADIYYVPVGDDKNPELILLPLKGDNTYEYDKADYFKATPEILAAVNDPKRDVDDPVEVDFFDVFKPEDLGKKKKTDPKKIDDLRKAVAGFKKEYEARLQGAREELKAKGLIP